MAAKNGTKKGDFLSALTAVQLQQIEDVCKQDEAAICPVTGLIKASKYMSDQNKQFLLANVGNGLLNEPVRITGTTLRNMYPQFKAYSVECCNTSLNNIRRSFDKNVEQRARSKKYPRPHLVLLPSSFAALLFSLSYHTVPVCCLLVVWGVVKSMQNRVVAMVSVHTATWMQSPLLAWILLVIVVATRMRMMMKIILWPLRQLPSGVSWVASLTNVIVPKNPLVLLPATTLTSTALLVGIFWMALVVAASSRPPAPPCLTTRRMLTRH